MFLIHIINRYYFLHNICTDSYLKHSYKCLPENLIFIKLISTLSLKQLTTLKFQNAFK